MLYDEVFTLACFYAPDGAAKLCRVSLYTCIGNEEALPLSPLAILGGHDTVKT